MEMNKTLGLICFGGFVLVAYFAIMAAIALVNTQAKQKSIMWDRQALARDAFADVGTPKQQFRLLLVFGLAFISVLGMPVSLVIAVVQWAAEPSKPPGVTFAAALFFVVTSIVAGFIINREINKEISRRL
jgi:membrane associated rhomboid family serine protease